MFQQTREYQFDGHTFVYYPYLTPSIMDKAISMFGDEGTVRDKWTAQVWCSLVRVILPDGSIINPPSMDVDLQWVKENLSVRVVSELIDKMDDGEVPLGINSQMEESDDPIMTIWKSWDTIQPLGEELTGSSTTPSPDEANLTVDFSVSGSASE